MGTYTNVFKDRLKALRGKTGRTIAAQNIGISRAALIHYENGDRKPDIEIFGKIADYYNVSTEYLLGYTDVKSIDMTVQDIANQTGLLENAINLLMKNPSIADVINILLLEYEYADHNLLFHLSEFLSDPDCRVINDLDKNSLITCGLNLQQCIDYGLLMEISNDLKKMKKHLRQINFDISALPDELQKTFREKKTNLQMMVDVKNYMTKTLRELKKKFEDANKD